MQKVALKEFLIANLEKRFWLHMSIKVSHLYKLIGKLGE